MECMLQALNNDRYVLYMYIVAVIHIPPFMIDYIKT